VFFCGKDIKINDTFYYFNKFDDFVIEKVPAQGGN